MDELREDTEVRAHVIRGRLRGDGRPTPPGARPGGIADGLARLRVRYPEIQIVFADSRKFAEEWTYRFLAAALADSMGADVSK